MIIKNIFWDVDGVLANLNYAYYNFRHRFVLRFILIGLYSMMIIPYLKKKTSNLSLHMKILSAKQKSFANYLYIIFKLLFYEHPA